MLGVLFLILNIQKFILIMIFMIFSAITNLELDWKIQKIIFRVNFRIFEIRGEIPEFSLIMIFGILLLK